MGNTNLKDRLNEKIQHEQPEAAEEAKVIDMPDADTAPAGHDLPQVNSNYIALTNNALDIISGNLKNQALSYGLFDIIKAPSGGMTAFTVPGLSGDEVQKELTGIILDYRNTRAYWNTPDPVEGTPPICFSLDSVTSYLERKPCARCVFNDFGSKDGESNAKACKESVEIYLLRPDNIMPIIVRVPVSSKQIFHKYMGRLVGCMLPVSGVVTRITLEKKTNKAGQPYAQYNFESVEKLSQEEAASAKAFGQKFMEILNADDEQPEIAEAV